MYEPHVASNAAGDRIIGIGASGPAYDSLSTTLPANETGYISYFVEIWDQGDCFAKEGGLRSHLGDIMKIRWQACRNGVLVYDGPIVQYPNGMCPWTNRFINRSSFGMFHAMGSYVQGSGFADPGELSTSSAATRVWGWGAYNGKSDRIGTINGSPSFTANGITRIFDHNFAASTWQSGNLGVNVPWQGMWYGNYYNASLGDLGQERMGLCNTFGSDCRNGMVFHPDNETTSTFSETAADQGTQVRQIAHRTVEILCARH